jgi:hypothetical protein
MERRIFMSNKELSRLEVMTKVHEKRLQYLKHLNIWDLVKGISNAFLRD